MRILVRVLKVVFCVLLIYVVLVFYLNSKEKERFNATKINSSFKEVTGIWGKPKKIIRWNNGDTFTAKYNNKWFGLSRIYFKFSANDSILINKISDN